MENDLKTLLEKVVLNDETKAALVEAWNTKVTNVREEVAVEIREEFANRFNHDKKVVVEAMEGFLTENLKKEIKTLVESQKKLAEERIAFSNKSAKLSEKVTTFLAKKLTEEMAEFHGQRKDLSASLNKTEKFVISKLAEEIAEFKESKDKLIKERVEVQKEKKMQIEEARKRFVEKASAVAEKVISEGLKAEFSQLREELAEARKLTFGRKLFEAFSEEFGVHFFNESKTFKQVNDKVITLEAKLSEVEQSNAAKDKEIFESKKQTRLTQELMERNEVMIDLMSPLSKDKRAVMRKLLESVETRKLREHYNKFLPTVLDNTTVKSNLTETRIQGFQPQERMKTVDGNRKGLDTLNEQEHADIAELKRLATHNF